MEMLNQSSRPHSFVDSLRWTVSLEQSKPRAKQGMKSSTSQPMLKIKQMGTKLKPLFGINESQVNLRFEENPNNPFSLPIHKNSPD